MKEKMIIKSAIKNQNITEFSIDKTGSIFVKKKDFLSKPSKQKGK